MAIIGIMAMIMSTVDSFINSTAVLVVHDFLKPLKIEFNRNELLSARIISIVIGLVSLLLSLRQGNFFDTYDYDLFSIYANSDCTIYYGSSWI